jgi:hypothetical protein
MIAQRFGFTKNFAQSEIHTVIPLLSKIFCGFKDQAKARPSGEKCGLNTGLDHRENNRQAIPRPCHRTNLAQSRNGGGCTIGSVADRRAFSFRYFRLSVKKSCTLWYALHAQLECGRQGSGCIGKLLIDGRCILQSRGLSERG